jgi:copper resistance protein D
MVPIFAPDGGFTLVLSRGFAVAFLLSVSGTLVFGVFVARRVYGRMPPGVIAAVDRRLVRWARVSAFFSVIGFAAWFAAVTASLAGPKSLGDWLSDLRAVLTDTSFGHIVFVQVLLLLLIGTSLGQAPSQTRWRINVVLGTAATILQVGHGHAYAMAKGLTFLEVSEVLHLWAASAWLGGLVPLLIVVQAAPHASAALAARWFSPLGKFCVVVLAASAFVQGWVLVGSVKALLHTAYGWTALLKFGLFAVLFGFAVLNRYWLAPELRGHQPDIARGRLINSLVLQTGFGLLIVLVAALLGQLRPGMSMSMQG